MAQRIEWLECLLPKPKLSPPVLIDFLSPWRVVDVCGQELEVFPPPDAAAIPAVVQQLRARYPDLTLSSRMHNLLMD